VSFNGCYESFVKPAGALVATRRCCVKAPRTSVGTRRRAPFALINVLKRDMGKATDDWQEDAQWPSPRGAFMA
jgi:hypothetical protein